MTDAAPHLQPKLPRGLLPGIVLIAAIVAGVTGPLPPREQPAAPAWVIPEHQEAAVLAWLGPLTDGAQLTPTWRVADVAIAPDALRLNLQGKPPQPEPNAVAEPNWVTLRLDCTPPKLAVELPPRLPPEIAQTVQVAAAALKMPGPFQLAQPVARSQPIVSWQLLALAYLTLRFFSVLAALLAAVWLFGRLPRSLLLPYLALTLLAGVARAWLSPATFLHEFYHVDEALSSLAGQPGFFNGYEGPALYSALVPWLHWDPSWLFAVNFLASTLTVPALARLAATLWDDERAGLAAGLLLALSPLHLRWGAAEDQWILATAWAVLALAAWLDALAQDDWLAALVALLAAVLAMHARPELLPFPVLLLGLALAHRRAWLLPWLRTRRAWLTLVVAAVALWPMALLLLHRPEAPRASLEHLQPWRASQWRNVAWTPLFLQILSVVALALALFGRRWSVLVLLLGAAVWTALPMLFYGPNGPFLERTQLLSTAWLLAIVAGALPLLLRAVPQPVWLAGLLLAMLVAVQDRYPAITAIHAQQREWLFLRDTVPKLAPPKRLLALSGHTLDRFPVVLFAPDAQPTLLSQEEAVTAHRWPVPGADLLYYQSMACWFAEPDEPMPPPGMHPRCAAVRDHYVLQPVAVTELAGPVGPLLRPTQGGGYQVGFFRLIEAR
jgi:hypothetical protein